MVDLSSLQQTSSTPGDYGGGQGNLLQMLLGRQPSALQSIATALPFLSLGKKQKDIYAPANNYANAAVDTTNPLYQQVYGQQQEMGKQNLADEISQLSDTNRKLASMGRVPLFDPERGGEQMFRNITKGYQDIQNTAGNNARGILSNAATQAYQLAGRQSQLASNNAGVKGNLLGALTHLFGL